ncbi:MAG TPA: nucleotidyltransferase family protein [Thermoanaerobaculia bacterium]
MNGPGSTTPTNRAVVEPPNLERTLERDTRLFYRNALQALRRSGVPFLLGGAFAFGHYTGIVRDTKDLDVFLKESDFERAVRALEPAGYRTEITHPHWLGKVMQGDDFIDLIFSGGNGIARVDDLWFEHATPAQILDVPVQITAPEEMIWSKAFIMERERFDGADVAHLIRACHARIEWGRLLERFADDWRVLLTHLVLFGYVYPGEREKIPMKTLAELLDRVKNEEPSKEDGKLCRGTLLSRAQYLEDVLRWGYRDARLEPEGAMTAEEVAEWTAAIDPSSRT